jgi:ankyrin repeat protein
MTKLKQLLFTSFMLCFGITEIDAMSCFKGFVQKGIISNYYGWQLVDAIRDNNVQEVRDLIVKGAKVDFVYNAGGGTPLLLAVAMQHTEQIALLLEAGADVNVQATFKTDDGGSITMSPTMLATTLNDPRAFAHAPQICKMLLARRADVTLRGKITGRNNINGLTALMHAAIGGNANVIPILIEAQTNEANNPLLRKLTYLLRECWEIAPIEICDELLPFAYDVINDIDHSGKTPLILAAWGPTLPHYHGKMEATIKILLDAGADATIHDKDGHTARYYAEQLPASPERDRVIAMLASAELS